MEEYGRLTGEIKGKLIDTITEYSRALKQTMGGIQSKIGENLTKHGNDIKETTEKIQEDITSNLEKTEDQEILLVEQPFYAWRALVLASPVWYPTLKIEVRRKLVNLAVNLLSTETIDLKKMNIYLE